MPPPRRSNLFRLPPIPDAQLAFPPRNVALLMVIEAFVNNRVPPDSVHDINMFLARHIVPDAPVAFDDRGGEPPLGLGGRESPELGEVDDDNNNEAVAANSVWKDDFLGLYDSEDGGSDCEIKAFVVRAGNDEGGGGEGDAGAAGVDDAGSGGNSSGDTLGDGDGGGGAAAPTASAPTATAAAPAAAPNNAQVPLLPPSPMLLDGSEMLTAPETLNASDMLTASDMILTPFEFRNPPEWRRVAAMFGPSHRVWPEDAPAAALPEAMDNFQLPALDRRQMPHAANAAWLDDIPDNNPPPRPLIWTTGEPYNNGIVYDLLPPEDPTPPVPDAHNFMARLAAEGVPSGRTTLPGEDYGQDDFSPFEIQTQLALGWGKSGLSDVVVFQGAVDVPAPIPMSIPGDQFPVDDPLAAALNGIPSFDALAPLSPHRLPTGNGLPEIDSPTPMVHGWGDGGLPEVESFNFRPHALPDADTRSSLVHHGWGDGRLSMVDAQARMADADANRTFLASSPSSLADTAPWGVPPSTFPPAQTAVEESALTAADGSAQTAAEEPSRADPGPSQPPPPPPPGSPHPSSLSEASTQPFDIIAVLRARRAHLDIPSPPPDPFPFPQLPPVNPVVPADNEDGEDAVMTDYDNQVDFAGDDGDSPPPSPSDQLLGIGGGMQYDNGGPSNSGHSDAAARLQGGGGGDSRPPSPDDNFPPPTRAAFSPPTRVATMPTSSLPSTTRVSAATASNEHTATGGESSRGNTGGDGGCTDQHAEDSDGDAADHVLGLRGGGGSSFGKTSDEEGDDESLEDIHERSEPGTNDEGYDGGDESQGEVRFRSVLHREICPWNQPSDESSDEASQPPSDNGDHDNGDRHRDHNDGHDHDHHVEDRHVEDHHLGDFDMAQLFTDDDDSQPPSEAEDSVRLLPLSELRQPEEEELRLPSSSRSGTGSSRDSSRPPSSSPPGRASPEPDTLPSFHTRWFAPLPPEGFAYRAPRRAPGPWFNGISDSRRLQRAEHAARSLTSIDVLREELSAIPLDEMAAATAGLVGAPPNRTVWDTLVYAMWQVGSLDDFRSFFLESIFNVQHGVWHAPAEEWQTPSASPASSPRPSSESSEEQQRGRRRYRIGEYTFRPMRVDGVRISPVSPLASFIDQTVYRFQRLSHHYVVKLWVDFVNYRAPTEPEYYPLWAHLGGDGMLPGRTWTVDSPGGTAASCEGGYDDRWPKDGWEAGLGDVLLPAGVDGASGSSRMRTSSEERVTAAGILYGHRRAARQVTGKVVPVGGAGEDDVAAMLKLFVMHQQKTGSRVPKSLWDQFDVVLDGAFMKPGMANFARFFDRLAAADVNGTFSSLHKYFDLMLRDGGKYYHQYALMNQGVAEGHFGDGPAAVRSMMEATLTARNRGDPACTTVCMSWLYHYLRDHPHLAQAFPQARLLVLAGRVGLPLLRTHARAAGLLMMEATLYANEARVALEVGHPPGSAFSVLWLGSEAAGIYNMGLADGTVAAAASDVYARLGLGYQSAQECEVFLRSRHIESAMLDDIVKVTCRLASLYMARGEYHAAVAVLHSLDDGDAMRTAKAEKYMTHARNLQMLQRAHYRGDEEVIRECFERLVPSMFKPPPPAKFLSVVDTTDSDESMVDALEPSSEKRSRWWKKKTRRQRPSVLVDPEDEPPAWRMKSWVANLRGPKPPVPPPPPPPSPPSPSPPPPFRPKWTRVDPGGSGPSLWKRERPVKKPRTPRRKKAKAVHPSTTGVNKRHLMRRMTQWTPVLARMRARAIQMPRGRYQDPRQWGTKSLSSSSSSSGSSSDRRSPGLVAMGHWPEDFEMGRRRAALELERQEEMERERRAADVDMKDPSPPPSSSSSSSSSSRRTTIITPLRRRQPFQPLTSNDSRLESMEYEMSPPPVGAGQQSEESQGQSEEAAGTDAEAASILLLISEDTSSVVSSGVAKPAPEPLPAPSTSASLSSSPDPEEWWRAGKGWPPNLPRPSWLGSTSPSSASLSSAAHSAPGTSTGPNIRCQKRGQCSLCEPDHVPDPPPQAAEARTGPASGSAPPRPPKLAPLGTMEPALAYPAELLRIEVLMRLGRLQEAFALVEGLMVLAKAGPDIHVYTQLMLIKADLWAAARKPKRGFTLIMRAWEKAKAAHHVTLMVRAATSLAHLLITMGENQAAAQMMHIVGSYAAESDDAWLTGRVYMLLADALVAEHQDPLEHLDRAFALFTMVGDHAMQVETRAKALAFATAMKADEEVVGKYMEQLQDLL